MIFVLPLNFYFLTVFVQTLKKINNKILEEWKRDRVIRPKPDDRIKKTEEQIIVTIRPNHKTENNHKTKYKTKYIAMDFI